MEDYRMERRRLKAAIAEKELLLKEDIKELQSYTKPFTAISKVAGSFITSKDKHEKDLIDKGVESAVTFLLRNVLLAKAGWITKAIVPIIAKNYAVNKLDEQKSSIIHTVRDWLHRYQARQRDVNLHDGTPVTHYDRSTADTNL